MKKELPIIFTLVTFPTPFVSAVLAPELTGTAVSFFAISAALLAISYVPNTIRLLKWRENRPYKALQSEMSALRQENTKISNRLYDLEMFVDPHGAKTGRDD